MIDQQKISLTDLIEDLVPSWAPVEPVDFTYLPGGYSNENYRFEYDSIAYVLRIPSRARPFVDRSRELLFYQSAPAVPMAELVAFNPDSGAMLTRFQEGPLLTDANQSPESIVSYLLSFHAALPASGRQYDPLWLSREFLSLGRVPDVIRRLSQRNWVPEVSAPCHNDLNPWNVIFASPERWVTLDWEWFGDNDPLFDLVTLHQGLEMDDDSLLQMVERWSDGQATNARLESCLIAFWIREYAWAHAEHQHGSLRQEIEDQLNTAAGKLAALTS